MSADLTRTVAEAIAANHGVTLAGMDPLDRLAVERDARAAIAALAKLGGVTDEQIANLLDDVPLNVGLAGAFENIATVRALLAQATAPLHARIAELERKLALPCGSCHPCNNWANETWVRAGKRLPHVYEWDEAKSRAESAEAEVTALRATVERVRALCDDERDRLAPIPESNLGIRVSVIRAALDDPQPTPPAPLGMGYDDES
jgi:hypothetical protein